MRYQIAICDDDPQIHRQLTALLQKIAPELDVQFEILNFTSAEQLLFEHTKAMDILILDIMMGKMTGMEAAKKLRSRGIDVPIIFLTSMPEYALEGYEVHAYSFLVKPVQEDVLKARIQDLLRILSQTHPVFIKLKNRDGIDIVDIRSVVYMESFSHDIVVHFADHSKTYPTRMTDLEDTLSAHDFFRIHKSFLINLHQISNIGDGCVTMKSGQTLPISRNRRKDFLIRFTDFLN